MGSDDRSHVRHTAVTTLYIIPVEQLMKPVVFREVLAHQFQEPACDVCSDVLIIM